jgi:hypothetical protein
MNPVFIAHQQENQIMELLFERLAKVIGLSVVLAISGCATSKYSDGTTAGVCIGLMCPVNSAMGLLDQGRNPASDFIYKKDLPLGATSYNDILKLYSNPNSQGDATFNGTKVYSVSYGHADPSGEPSEAGVIPSHVATYYFTSPESHLFSIVRAGDLGKDKILIGRIYTSSYKSDNTNFDESKISGIVKGKSTRAEVIQLMGEPSGLFGAPMDNAVEYVYATTRIGATPNSSISKSKMLKVTFAENDVVADVLYAEK